MGPSSRLIKRNKVGYTGARGGGGRKPYLQPTPFLSGSMCHYEPEGSKRPALCRSAGLSVSTRFAPGGKHPRLVHGLA